MLKKTFIRILVLFVCGIGPCTAIANDTSWVFSTITGQLLEIEHQKNGYYSLTSNDITVRVDSCDSNSVYKICFLSSLLDIAIPSHRPEPGASWKVRGTEFTLEQILKELNILNSRHENIYVIHVRRDQNFYLPNANQIKFSLLFYSYEIGLLAFQDLDEDKIYNVTFFSSVLPSLGQ